ncbi:F0F1 ATP synthase subunit B [Antrihabitans sp. YC3-6]|uniref:ATP synthase subunit b n=1 Tax=Antrihabitans stalagmiti TaxID=2799499 RepID=A0A934NTW2_9NOCA|nr:F0F1 ATP synthase subunit B [Antrihabitans stalagmiti]MBJ8341209.1 F0F1 ATP synthase subunit B [Antrihabitans stalagmiti]
MDSTLLAAEGGEEKTNNFLIPNGTFFVELIIFLVVLGVIWKFVVPPIRAVLDERAERVAKTTDDNHRAARAFADADAKYRGELMDARGEAAKIRDAARGEGQQILDQMRTKARQESDAIQKQADEELQAQARKVASDLQSGVGPLSDTLANRVLGVDANGSGKASLADQTGRV